MGEVACHAPRPRARGTHGDDRGQVWRGLIQEQGPNAECRTAARAQELVHEEGDFRGQDYQGGACLEICRVAEARVSAVPARLEGVLGATMSCLGGVGSREEGKDGVVGSPRLVAEGPRRPPRPRYKLRANRFDELQTGVTRGGLLGLPSAEVPQLVADTDEWRLPADRVGPPQQVPDAAE